jgi:hypothetical protein
MSRHRTAMGKSIDMAGLIARNEKTRAVGNKSVNARGDSIDQQGRIVQGVNDRVANSYQSTVGSTGAIKGLSQSANPNAPLSPKQLRELAAINSGVIEEKPRESAHPLLDEVAKKAPVTEEYVAPIEAEIAPIPPVEPEEFVMKSADELHPEEAELAELEEDFDIEAIKAACLENTITTPEDK